MAKLKKPVKLIDYAAEASALFKRAVYANITEAAGSMVFNRCTHPISGIDGQDTCDLPVDGIALIDQTKQQQDGGPAPNRCCVHWECAAYKSGGVDTSRVYDGSDYASELDGIVKAAKQALKPGV
ncbi:MAG: hypothetical protein KGQ41_00725 [Alphaproteobacteria bacterium]|nr:hypothetical protein [Alphaproteobacteria bacterium]